MHLRQPGLMYSKYGPFIKKQRTKIKRLDRAKNKIKQVFNMIWIMVIEYYTIRHLILEKIHSMTDIKEGLLQWFTNFC